jgi:diguanylate cyclase (GGDEF)-like protein
MIAPEGHPRSDDSSHVTPADWAGQKLAEFLALIADFSDERAASRRGVEWIAEVFDAEAAALLRADELVASIGFGVQAAPREQLVAISAGQERSLELPGVGELRTVSIPVDQERSLRLVVARAAEEFDRAELDLLRGMGRVLSLGLRAIRLIQAERSHRVDSDRQASQNARLLAALRERQVLLERLSRLQRSIVDRRSLPEVLDALVESACELLGDDVGLLRRHDDPDAPTELIASIGVRHEALAHQRRPAAPDGVGERSMRERRLIVSDAVSGSDPPSLNAEFGAADVRAAIAAPFYVGGVVAGNLAVGSRDEQREYGPRDQQILLAFAECASLALNHAHALDEAQHEAFHDGLTGLPNRSLFIDRLGHAVDRSARSGAPVGVLFCDLDGFKTVNDSLGHSAGDRLLVSVAGRLRDCLRPADTVARLGGDDFAVLLEEMRGAGDAARAAQRILNALEAPFQLAAREVYVTVSIGIATGTADADNLLRDADLAMYRAKSEGKGRYAVYEPTLHSAIVERLELEVDLRRAIERGELELAYQPIFSLRTGAVAGLEALARWRHPTRGVIPPGRFIPLAEESGDIRALGAWVLREACQRAALWRARYPGFPGLQVSVNISGVQLREPGLVDEVAAALADAQLEPAGLALEITETALMEEVETASRRLEELKGLGIEIAVDDFGTGYSSLKYLQRFPLDSLKIERAFVDPVGRSDEEPALLRAIVDLAEIFGLRPIAEGIERSDQPQRLLELGCDLGQGHLLAEPLGAADADALLLQVGLLGSGEGEGPSLGSPATDEGVAPPSDPARTADRPRPGAGGGAGPG